MKVLITGAHGQLGRDITKIFQLKGYETIALSKKQLDITNKREVVNTVNDHKPHIIVHPAAYTAVDDCEIHPEYAYLVNSYGTKYVAEAAENVDSILVYISTDYVFDGKKGSPYNEEDTPNPLSIYGKSKLLGEQFVQEISSRSYILRTSWLYGHHGKNFVKTMINLAKKGEAFSVVTNQVGSPTYTKDIANIIPPLIGKPFGIYHVSNQGSCSWFTFAHKILALCGFDPNLVQPTTTQEFGSVAPRPAYSVLSTKKLEQQGIMMPKWEESLKVYLTKEGSI